MSGRGRVAGRLGRHEATLGVRIVEPGQDLALGDLHALVDQDVEDPRRDLGRDRGPAPRRDVAAGVEEGGPAALAGGPRGRDLDDGRPATERQERHGDGQHDERHDEAHAKAAPPAPAIPHALINPEPREVRAGRSLLNVHIYAPSYIQTADRTITGWPRAGVGIESVP